jgi:hypothetical protein
MLAPAQTYVPQRARGAYRPSGTPRQTGLSAACAGWAAGEAASEAIHSTRRTAHIPMAECRGRESAFQN